jgi:hypothetical protein
MAYKVHVTKAIWADEECTDLFDELYRDVELPFVPFIGLAIQQDGWYCGPIERITWDEADQLFRAESQGFVPDGETSAKNRKRIDIDTHGWKSHKVK